MNIMIIEDEKFARENLERLILEIKPEAKIVASMDTVKESVEWLKSNQADLLFLDIHLADDISFKIFDQVEVKTPIIFTTAYDQYAIKAFKVNSIDYLLKPIDKEELVAAFQQYDNLKASAQIDISSLQSLFNAKRSKTYQKRFMVTRNDKIMSIKVEDIAWFEGEDRYVYLTKKDGSRYIVDYRLSDLEDLLNPDLFFRLNRSFIACLESIEKIVAVSKSRVKVHLNPAATRDIVVSTEVTRQFKAWLNQ